jgi:hypothetical protein
MITLELTQRELDVVRQALRTEEERHKRNDFKVLVLEIQELRSKIVDSVINTTRKVLD